MGHKPILIADDGAKPGRDYYTEFAELTPDDTIILTLACGKYRFNKMI